MWPGREDETPLGFSIDSPLPGWQPPDGDVTDYDNDADDYLGLVKNCDNNCDNMCDSNCDNNLDINYGDNCDNDLVRRDLLDHLDHLDLLDLLDLPDLLNCRRRQRQSRREG